MIALLVTTCVQAQDVIQMEKKGGVYKVPCKINGLALKFVFDTGASDVSISLTEALFMYKNDYLQESDFKGTEYYRIANGDIAEGTKVILKTVEIGKQKLYNVEASVVHSLEAPLLFGQSALQRFGKFTVDYSNNTLVIGGFNIFETLKRYVEVANSGKYKSWEEINAKFPELSSYDIEVLKEYVATANSGKYKSWEEINAKFPEFKYH